MNRFEEYAHQPLNSDEWQHRQEALDCAAERYAEFGGVPSAPALCYECPELGSTGGPAATGHGNLGEPYCRKEYAYPKPVVRMDRQQGKLFEVA
jgi:hypothetical protein